MKAKVEELHSRCRRTGTIVGFKKNKRLQPPALKTEVDFVKIGCKILLQCMHERSIYQLALVSGK